MTACWEERKAFDDESNFLNFFHHSTHKTKHVLEQITLYIIVQSFCSLVVQATVKQHHMLKGGCRQQAEVCAATQKCLKQLAELQFPN